MRMSSLKDYAALCGLPIRTLRRFCQEGILPAMKIGRVYYVDTQAADQALRETVNRSTAGKLVTPDIPECRIRKTSFDFLAEINRLKRESC